jgi:hypothetical protein
MLKIDPAYSHLGHPCLCVDPKFWYGTHNIWTDATELSWEEDQWCWILAAVRTHSEMSQVFTFVHLL